MGSIRKAMASVLAVLALTAFVSDAQTRRSSDVKKSTPTRQSTTRSSSQQTSRPSRSSSVQNRKSNDRKQPSTTVTRPSARPSTPASRPSAPETRPSKPSAKPANDKPSQVRPDKPSQVTRPAPDRPSGNRPSDRPGKKPDNKPGMKPGPKPGKGPGKPVTVRPNHRPEPPRVHPRERDFLRWDRPSYYWSHNNHYYGHRVKMLPSHVLRHVFNGITYYCYNDIWYRPYGGYYVVCRPPYGLSLAADIISDIAWAAVTFSYATAAAQNAAILQNQQLGLTQSSATAGSEYFYQDGVFYSRNASGEYHVIVPPVGAMVETLPEDYDMVKLTDGNEYYKVDDTVYKVVISDGRPYFEVVGQLYD